MRRLKAPREPPAELATGLDAIRAELDVPGEFPPEAQREADEAARALLPEREDRRDVELFTIDPPGSMDLDQAMALERRPGGGYRIRYAIADVGAFVRPGGALEPRRTGARSPATCRTATRPFTRACCRRPRQAFCPAATGRRCCGRSS